MPNDADYCADLVRQADRDRYLAALFAPAEHRTALLSLYAFNIEIARVRDLAREPMPGEIRLQWWREVLSGERQGEGEANPVSAALLETLKHYGFVAAPLLELIDAHTFDLYDEPMGTVDSLELYGIRTQAPLLAMAAGVLNQGGARSISISAAGVFQGSAAETQILANSLNGSIDNYQLVFADGHTLTGQFLVQKLSYSGDFNNERSYTIQLESSGLMGWA